MLQYMRLVMRLRLFSSPPEEGGRALRFREGGAVGFEEETPLLFLFAGAAVPPGGA